MKIYIKPAYTAADASAIKWLSNINLHTVTAIKNKHGLGSGTLSTNYAEEAYQYRDQLLAKCGAELKFDDKSNQHYIEFDREENVTLFMIRWM